MYYQCTGCCRESIC